MNAQDTRPPSPTAPARPGVSSWWRLGCVVLGMVTLVVGAASWSMFEQFKAQIGHLQTKLQQQPQIRHIAVLLDKDQRPAMLVTVDPSTGRLQAQRLNEVKEGREDSMQLWALATGQRPRSLGLTPSTYKTLQLPLDAGALAQATELAVSVENKGGALDDKGPTEPYLYRGALVQKAL